MVDDRFSYTITAEDMLRKGLSPEEVQEILAQMRMPSLTFSGVLNDLLGKKNMTVDVLAGQAEIDPATIYRFMNNQRNPSRNALLRIAFAMNATLDETQLLLKSGNCAALSGSRIRDLLIMNGIINGKYFDDVNQLLVEKNLPDLNGRG